MNEDTKTQPADEGRLLSEGLGPLPAEADMGALKAVAHQAGLKGIDLHALARVLDAAQRVAVAAERERLCAAIKAADDKASECDYMLDSNDCISVIRGTWAPDWRA